MSFSPAALRMVYDKKKIIFFCVSSVVSTALEDFPDMKKQMILCFFSFIDID